MSAIQVVYSFARSGGTLVNQLLGVHPQCLVLSEVNPASSCKPVAEQAAEWLGLIAAEEAGPLSRLPYARQVKFLYERAQERGKSLIVRDWVTVNFLPGCAGDFAEPSRQLEQELYLTQAGFRPQPIVVSRRSAAVYESIRHNFRHFHDLEAEVFAESYLEYARAVAHLPRIHLETLQSRPDATLREVLQLLGLASTQLQALLDGFCEFRNCTGNTTLAVQCESSLARRILPPMRAERSTSGPMPTAFAEADRLLGYGQQD